jgi:hypothetical protein
MYEKCPVCGPEVIKGSKKCTSCNTIMSDYLMPENPVKECIHCFQGIDDRATKCNHCGDDQFSTKLHYKDVKGWWLS